jgi:dTDP-4-amino-4,6-dideoxygalactose transaminase
MNIPFVDLKSQYESIKTDIDTAIFEVLAKTAFVGGPFVDKFEHAFAEYCGTKHCIGVANGTDAIFIALKALGVGPGDEVITAANSFIASSEAVTMAGAQVVFADIDPATYNLNVSMLEEKITPRTRAIIPIHLYGQPADMDPILELAGKYNLKVIEDAAQAHGSLYRGRKAGTLGDAASFSFYPSKNLGAYGDGGAIVTDDDEVAEMARMFSNHGSAIKYHHNFEGVNSRLDDLQAAILSAKLGYLDTWTERRRANASLYNSHLRDTQLILPVEIDDVRAVYHLYVVRVDKGRRSSLQEHLRSCGIGTGIHYPIALPNLKAYEHLACKKDDFPEATRASEEILSLPMFPELNEDQIIHVRNAICEFFDRS